MISYIKGEIINLNSVLKDHYIEVLTNYGVGYKIFMSQKEIERLELGNEVELWTYQHIREDAQLLFGFVNKADRGIFEMLITVSGVGPKIGMAILNIFTCYEIEEIIFSGEHKRFTEVSGVGTKVAQKIILELQSKVTFNPLGESKAKGLTNKSILSDLEDALISLGYKGGELKKVVKMGEEIYKSQKDITLSDLVGKVLRNN